MPFNSTKVSFINMVADICEPVGANVTQVALGMGPDPRMGGEFLNAGIGFGGYCFRKDPRASSGARARGRSWAASGSREN